MNYTLANIHTAPSYDALKRNGFSDLDVVAYYGTPILSRAEMLIQIKSKNQAKKFNAPTYENRGTQKCTGSLFSQVEVEFRKQINTTFEVGGVNYNLNNLGYTFGWNTNRSRGGVHMIRRKGIFMGETFTEKRIELSKWVLENSDKTFDQWVNTILHEIAHAIDYARRGTSDHSYKWKTVARTIGCSGDRCYNAKVDAKASKYTVKCPSCGNEKASHKHSKVIARGHRSCGKCSPNRYNDKYKLIQIQNY